MKPDRKILFDENIPHKLRSYFDNKGIVAETMHYHGWIGYRNGELSKLVRDNNFILITRDRDFLFLWEKYKIQVVYLAIDPPLLLNLQSAIERLFNKWQHNSSNPFLIMVQKDTIRIWK